jgi:uncharacterized protein YneF (UPF0154 family)
MNRKELAILAIIVFLSVIAWMIFGIFAAKNNTSITQKELKQVIPLTPTFDNDIIKGLKGREE